MPLDHILVGKDNVLRFMASNNHPVPFSSLVPSSSSSSSSSNNNSMNVTTSTSVSVSPSNEPVSGEVGDGKSAVECE